MMISLEDLSILLALTLGALGGLLRTVYQNGDLGKKPLEEQRNRFLYNAFFGAITTGGLAFAKLLQLPDPTVSGFYVFIWGAVTSGFMWTLLVDMLGGSPKTAKIASFLAFWRKKELEESSKSEEEEINGKVLEPKNG